MAEKEITVELKADLTQPIRRLKHGHDLDTRR